MGTQKYKSTTLLDINLHRLILIVTLINYTYFLLNIMKRLHCPKHNLFNKVLPLVCVKIGNIS